jgi:hypothetical protein
MSNSSDEASEVGDEYVVVVTIYPTTYGCYTGMNWTEKELLERSDYDVYGPDGKHSKKGGKSGAGSGFKKYEDAAAFALDRVDRECTFTENDYTEDDDLPFDSADCHNYDNDEETRIEVMSKSEFAEMMQSRLEKIMRSSEASEVENDEYAVDSDASEVGKGEYVVVVTTYPTTYGCNSGMNWMEKEFLERSDSRVYGPDGKHSKTDSDPPCFEDSEAAAAFALERVDRECTFTEHDYTEDDEPPFDSADCQNYDNDEETIIEVMTKSEFDEKMQSKLQKMGRVD